MLCPVDLVLKLLTPRSVNGCMTMAHDGMKEVVEPDEEVSYKIIFDVCSLQSVRVCILHSKFLNYHFGRLREQGGRLNAKHVFFSA